MGLLWPNSFIKFPEWLFPFYYLLSQLSDSSWGLSSVPGITVTAQGGATSHAREESCPNRLVRWHTNTHVPQQRVSVTCGFFPFLFNVESKNHTNLLSPLFHVLSPLLVCCSSWLSRVCLALGEARSCLDPSHVCACPHSDVSPLPDGFKLLL